MLTKMTLSMDSAVVAKARRISKHHRTSVSKMFSNYIQSLQEQEQAVAEPELPPITKRVLEMGAKLPQVPDKWDYRDELSDSLAERYDVK